MLATCTCSRLNSALELNQLAKVAFETHITAIDIVVLYSLPLVFFENYTLEAPIFTTKKEPKMCGCVLGV